VAVNGGDGVASRIAATGKPPGLVQDPQRGAPPGQVERHPGMWEGSAASRRSCSSRVSGVQDCGSRPSGPVVELTAAADGHARTPGSTQV